MHAWNGSWGVIATGLLAGQGLVLQSYGSNPDYSGPFELAADQSNLNVAPTDYFRQWGCFLGGNGLLLGCQIIYLMWLCGALKPATPAPSLPALLRPALTTLPCGQHQGSTCLLLLKPGAWLLCLCLPSLS